MQENQSTQKKICGAKTRSGGACQNPPVTGRNRCRMHGGASPRGFAHPSTKSGLYSKHIPSRLASTYEEQLKDPNLLDLKHQVSLIDSRTVELLSKLDTGESGETWRELKKHCTAAMEAAVAGNAAEMVRELSVMQKLIDVGNKDAEVWGEIYASVNLRKSLAETERRLLMQSEQMLSAEQVMLMVTAITNVIRTYVNDAVVLDRIVFGINRLITLEH